MTRIPLRVALPMVANRILRRCCISAVSVAMVLAAGMLRAQPAQDQDAALFAALKDHDTKEMKWLLAHGVSPSVQDATGHGALNLAAQNGDLDAVKVLLDAGAGIDDVDHFGPPIWYAATFNQVDTVKWLLAHGAKVDTRNQMDQTALIWCVRDNRTDMVRLLIDAGADINAVDRTKVDLLTVASRANNQEIVRLLEKAGARYTSAQDEMMAAAAFGDAVHIRQMVAAGTPVNFAAGNYASAQAAETPLMAAAEKGQTVAVRALLQAGAEVNATDREHETALFYAIKSGHRSTVEALLAAGADPKAKMGGGSTTLMQLATYMDDPELARRFIDAGVDPTARTDNGSVFSALSPAASFCHTQVLKVLIDAGVDVNLRTKLEGETALIDAARSGCYEGVQILLRAGADPTVRDIRPNSGLNAREWAEKFHHPDIAAIIPAK